MVLAQYFKEEGREEGRKEGRKEGEEIGLEKGREESRAKIEELQKLLQESQARNGNKQEE